MIMLNKAKKFWGAVFIGLCIFTGLLVFTLRGPKGPESRSNEPSKLEYLYHSTNINETMWAVAGVDTLVAIPAFHPMIGGQSMPILKVYRVVEGSKPRVVINGSPVKF